MRNYYRCADCLRIAVLEEDRAKWYNRTDMACGCGGRLEFMGTVKAGKLTKTNTVGCVAAMAMRWETTARAAP